ncbi:flagellar basal-body rod protein FlgG [Cerasibacillus quisquiliarum]|uniref:Flagellar hook-basal body complex protein FlhP n=1 Tax=Cerasibacillus quisquiliarum TaxID=227865 RepID=A0A511UZH5_9BACI|nr:flagellar hook-basal body protein [Cerasibacillus quisquiliarum]MBB5147080.1 flagellar basal-body rod protein FlgG [Cerasibacillus quisquiliarum]GEN32044.1 flagellar hook-basal body complex protein FlhP [Cerasibacillus quisquiliarum]
MSRMMIQAAVTMNQLQNKLDTIGNNLANSQTTGYKSRQTEFSSLLFQQINNMTDRANAEGRLTPDGIRVGSGAKLGSIQRNFAIGSIKQTDRSLDTVLLKENHFYPVQVEVSGNIETRYTRDGALYLHPTGTGHVRLVTSDGHPIMGLAGPIDIEEGFDDISIRSNGAIYVTRNGVDQFVDQLAIVEVIRPRVLEAAGDNLFRLPDLEALGYNELDILQMADDTAELVQSQALEQSNVNLAEEMTHLITTQRSYQMNARTITMGDQMMGLINQIRS